MKPTRGCPGCRTQPSVAHAGGTKSITVAVVSLLAAIVCAMSFTAVGSAEDAPRGAGTSASPLSAAGEIHALGRLEPAAGLITVGARPGARIESIQVRQGEKVAAGHVLAILEGHDQATAQVAVAEAARARAAHLRGVQKQKLALEREQADAIQKARLESAPGLLAARARFNTLTEQYKQLQSTLQGKERFDLEARYIEAENRFLRDSLEVRSAQASQGLVPRLRQIEDSELGETGPDLDLLDRQIDLARAGLSQTEVRAPAQGQILEVSAHAGEISSGPLLMMGDVTAMATAAEVFQSDIPRIRVGDAATVQVLDTSVTGKVTRIGSLVARNQMNPLDPRALQDRRVVKVWIGLSDPALAARLVNMEVEVKITPGSGDGAGPGTAPAPVATDRKPGS